MDELNTFPRKPLLFAVILCSLFVLAVTGACFYHPAIPHPFRIKLNKTGMIGEGTEGYYVTTEGASGTVTQPHYRLKMAVNGESVFYDLQIDQQLNDSSFAGRLLVHKATNPFGRDNSVEAIIYNDSKSVLPLIRLMFK